MATRSAIEDKDFADYCLKQSSQWKELARRATRALAPAPETIETVRLDSPETVDEFLNSRTPAR